MLTEAWQWIATAQSGVMRALAAEMRTGGLGTTLFAFVLGALHALTPGHGKATLVAYLLGTSAEARKGLRIALSAAALHVLSGFLAFLILRFILGQAPSITGRGSPTFTMVGYGLVALAGVMMVWQSIKPHDHGHDGGGALTLGMGLLPCPLTIAVLGFAWTQGSPIMVVATLISLALGIGATIGFVACITIGARHFLGATLAGYLPNLEKSAARLQFAGGLAVVAIGGYMMLAVR